MQSSKLSIMKNMIDLADEIIFIYHFNNKNFDYVNTAFTKITGSSNNTLSERSTTLFNLIHAEDRDTTKQKIRELLENKDPSTLTFRVIRADQQHRWIKFNIYPVIEAGNIAYITGIGQDITILKSSLESMEKLSAWKNESMDIISHDLREPIATIKMLAAVIDKKASNESEIRKITAMINEIANANNELITMLLKKETFESLQQQSGRKCLNVVSEINSAVKNLVTAEVDRTKKVLFTYSDKEILAMLDSVKFLQIVNVLISNAIKFTVENSQVRIHLEQLENAFLLSIQDSGIGIPKHLQQTLFRKYPENPKLDANGQESVGRSMWILKNLVEQHQGSVWFESQQALGTTFYVKIPLGLNN